MSADVVDIADARAARDARRRGWAYGLIALGLLIVLTMRKT